ncbi:MAG: iron ABC transporter permease, partial [Planctomycetota bacterium]
GVFVVVFFSGGAAGRGVGGGGGGRVPGWTGGVMGVLAVFLLWPIFLTVRGGFVDEATGGWTLRYFVGEGLGVLRDPLYLRGLGNALGIASATTVLCLLIALPMGVIGGRYEFRGKGVVTALVLVPLILPPFVGAIGMQALLGRFGAINSLLAKLGLIDGAGPGIDFLGGEGFLIGGRFGAVVLVEALHLYPILYLNIVAAVSNLDPSLEEAALNLGAGRWRRFRRCTLPLIGPGVFAGGTIVFIWSFTELGTPLMFEFKTVTPVQVFYGLTDLETNPRPYALVVVMLAVATGLYVVGKRAFGGRAYAMQNKATAAAAVKTLRGWRSGLAVSFFGGVTLLAVLPHLGVVLSSVAVDGTWYRSVLPGGWTGEHYAGVLSHDLAMRSVTNSLWYAGLAMVLCVGLGLAIAYLTVRAKVRGGWLLDALGMLPLAVPGLVMAFGYVAMSLHWPFPQLSGWMQGTLGGGDPGSWWYTAGGLLAVRGQAPNPLGFLVVAYTIRRLPYILRAAAAGLEQTSGDLEDAALNLGASRMTAVRRVVVPLIMANLIAGGILVFSFAMLEVSDSLVLAEKEPHYPITKAIWTLFNRLGDGKYLASAMGVWGMVLLTVTLAGASVLMGRRLGAVFRM